MYSIPKHIPCRCLIELYGQALVTVIFIAFYCRIPGFSSAYTNIGNVYFNGQLGVERNMRKAKQYYELAAMECPLARHNLGLYEELIGNVNRAVKYFTIAAGCGHGDSLKRIRMIYLDGYAPRGDYEKALRAYQAYLSEIRSDQRDQAAAFSDDYRYY